MAWSTPYVYSTGETLTATNLNTYISDNLSALKDPPSGNYEANEVADYTTTSTTFANVDATNFALTLTTNGGDVMVGFHGSVQASGAMRAYFEIDVDGSPHGGNDGIISQSNPLTTAPGDALNFVRLITGLSAGSHTFKLQWKVSAGTLTMYAGAGTSNADIHPQFWAREVS